MTSNRLAVLVIGATVLGVLFGLFLPGLMLALAFVGDLFVNILQIIFIPLVGSAIVSGVSAFTGQRQVIKAALATLTLFLGTTIVAIVIGLILVIVFQPGTGINTGTGFIPGEIVNAPVTQSLDFLSELIPSNIINAVTHGKFLGWMIALTVLAAVLGTLGIKAKPVTDFFGTIYAVVQKVLAVFVNLVPVGVFFLIGTVVARNSGNFGYLTDGLGKLSLVLLIGFLLHALLVVPALLKFFAKRSPWEYFVNIFPALKTALASSSATIALPVTIENCVERNKIDNRVAAMVLPIGSSLNVNGRALYVTVSALFIAQAFGLNLGITGMLYVALASLFFSLGTATVPFAGMLTLVSVFDSAGFPAPAYGGIGIIFVLDWFWGRVFATVDVWSSAAVAAVVEENIVTEVARPERKVWPEREPQRRFDREQERRDYPPRRRDDRKRPDFRQDRPERFQRPYNRPEREPVPPPRPDTRPEFSDRAKRPQPSSASPFELKAESSRAFNPEASKPAEPQAKPILSRKEAPEPQRDDRRLMREKKQFVRGHDVNKRGARDNRAKVEADFAEEKVAPPEPPPTETIRIVVPPPLIRDLESTKEKQVELPEPVVKTSEPAKRPEPINRPEPVESKSSEPEDSQTSLFGRVPHRKGQRPKSDEPPKPVEDAETYSTKPQDFGRGAKRKKPS
ncbi:MAG TPA: cation:dicarboxylase symporter family transporter [candidate division Zixibacteria bacterium]|nr:cation:dicarboxylase symporter family transporter [candidate division Zixibacteria bacterium]